MVSIIVAKSINNVIGINNSIPWHIPADLKMFKRLTNGNTIIMGRKTYESIGKPLPDRFNIVVSSTMSKTESGILVVKNLDQAILKAPKDKNVFIVGGQRIYEEALNKNLVDKLYVTEIEKEFDGDTFFPEINTEMYYLEEKGELIQEEKTGLYFRYNTYSKVLIPA